MNLDLGLDLLLLFVKLQSQGVKIWFSEDGKEMIANFMEERGWQYETISA